MLDNFLFSTKSHIRYKIQHKLVFAVKFNEEKCETIRYNEKVPFYEDQQTAMENYSA